MSDSFFSSRDMAVWSWNLRPIKFPMWNFGSVQVPIPDIYGSVITFLQLNLNQPRLKHILRIKVDQCQFTCSFPLEWDQRKFTHFLKITQHSRKTCWAMLTGGANSAMASVHQSCAVCQTVHTNHGIGKHPLWCSLPLITFWCTFSWILADWYNWDYICTNGCVMHYFGAHSNGFQWWAGMWGIVAPQEIRRWGALSRSRSQIHVINFTTQKPNIINVINCRATKMYDQ